MADQDLEPETVDYLKKCNNGKVEMQELNSCFATNVEKIRSLMQQNNKLSVEVNYLKSYKSTSATEIHTKEKKLTKEKEALQSTISFLKKEQEDLQKRWDGQKVSVFLEDNCACVCTYLFYDIRFL